MTRTSAPLNTLVPADRMKRILIVDDDKNVLSNFLLLWRNQYVIETALSGQEALNRLEGSEAFAVVVSDMDMPEMNGVEFLAQVHVRWPDTVRLMLTASEDQATAAEAVNKGQIFRFLNKPCQMETMRGALQAAVRQHELIVAEKELLEKTLNGSVQLLTEMLSLADAPLLHHNQQVRECLRELAKAISFERLWEIEVAAMLAPIGLMTLPPELAFHAHAGHQLAPAEQQLILRLPEIGSKLLRNIPRLEGVAQIVLYQKKNFDGSGFPKDLVAGAQIPLGARLLKLLNELVDLETAGTARLLALKELQTRTGEFDPQLLEAAVQHLAPPPPEVTNVPIAFKDLRIGHKLAAQVETGDGMRIVSAGYIITEPLMERLVNFEHLSGIKEPLYIEQVVESSG